MGQHPLVSRLLKGVFNQRPPKPRYEVTWDITKVLNYIDSLGESDSLSFQVLTWKLAMILALTRPSRSADLVRLDLQYRRHTPEGVVFQEPGLAKQSRQGKPRAEFFFPAFPSNSRLCPQQTLRAYEQSHSALGKMRSKLDCSWLLLDHTNQCARLPWPDG